MAGLMDEQVLTVITNLWQQYPCNATTKFANSNGSHVHAVLASYLLQAIYYQEFITNTNYQELGYEQQFLHVTHGT